MAKNLWGSDWNVGVRIWVERAGEAVLGEGRAELLAAIAEHHSITKAAKAAGMSYRRAWTLVQEANAASGEALVESTTGGVRGGGARLTPRGQLVLDVYEQVQQTLVDSAAGVLQRAVQPVGDATACVHLAAAISLQEAVGQILAEYALLRPAARVRVIYGASNELADHILAGAPGNVFISAEPAELDRLAAVGLVVASSRRVVAANGLAMIGKPGTKNVGKLSEVMSSKVKQVALAEAACPLGRYSKSYLESAGVYERLLPKVLYVDNSRAILAAVVSGAADVGLAFSSDAARSGAWQTLFRVPTAKAAATYEAAAVRCGKTEADARTLIEFLNSPTAARCFRRCGLKPAGQSAQV